MSAGNSEIKLVLTSASDQIALGCAITEHAEGLEEDARKGDEIARSALRALRKLARQINKQDIYVFLDQDERGKRLLFGRFLERAK